MWKEMGSVEFWWAILTFTFEILIYIYIYLYKEGVDLKKEYFVPIIQKPSLWI